MNIIIVLNYNDASTTYEFIQKIKDYNSLQKIIIVDNCSSDNSFTLLKELESEKVKVIQTSNNKGYASGNNFGIKYAEQNYKPKNIIISNPDIEVSDRSIKKICDYLDSQAKVVAASGLIHNLDNKVASNYAWKLPTYANILARTFAITSKISKIINFKYKGYDPMIKKNSRILPVDVIAGCFFAIKSDVFKELNYFDERTFLYNEENILAYKIKNKGYKQSILLDEKIVHFEGVSINKSIKNWKNKYKILGESRTVYLKEYLKVSKAKLLIFNAFFNLGKYEKYLLLNLRRKIKH
ncbi:glycosyltransferase [Virgibacillus halodenitrificans]|uniref:glycosyltransferase n=1 Tax=Virgibacillus halodenitrificans TaxID=1482 RepID=UPI00045C9E25|nr:glycosyltransferase family 2 protein [Virgibacillus halodenitrificans]CDQ31407.1 N-glycosyltransferase [Virgibacillus halodenitrificans]